MKNLFILKTEETPAPNPIMTTFPESSRKNNSARTILNLDKRMYGNFYSDKSREGYFFQSTTQKIHGIVNEIARPRSHIYKRSRTSQKSRLKFEKTSIEHIKNSEILTTIESIAAKAKMEISTNQNHPLLRAIKNEYMKNDKVKTGNSSDIGFKSLAQGISSIHKDKESQNLSVRAVRKADLSTMSLENAIKKVHESDMTTWLKKRGINKLDENMHLNFSSALFEQLDLNQTGKVEGEELIRALLFLGIASDPEVLRKTVCMIFKRKILKDVYVTLEDFKGLFRTNLYTDKILEILNNMSIAERAKFKVSEESIKNENLNIRASILKSQKAMIAFLKVIQTAVESKRAKPIEVNITINEHQRLLEK